MVERARARVRSGVVRIVVGVVEERCVSGAVRGKGCIVAVVRVVVT